MYRFTGFTQKANEALNNAITAAEDLGHTYVGSEHLLLGLLREGGGPAATGRAVSISCVFLSVKSRAQRLFPAGTNGPWENNLRMA